MENLNSKFRKTRIIKMSIDNTGNLIFEKIFGTQLSWMYSGIESTLKKQSGHSCALLLTAYTEVLGGLVTGNLKNHNEMRNNYVKFLEYLGEHYVSLHEKYDLYANVRNKLVHEFSPRPSYIIWCNESVNNRKFGIEIVNGNIHFNLKEYYRDFKNGIERLGEECSQDGMKIINLAKATSIDWANVIHKPKE